MRRLYFEENGESGMNEEQALKDLKLCLFGNGAKIESVKIAISALEKQIPKKIISCIDNGHNGRKCPNCNVILCNGQKEYCSRCGQKLDWSD